jgi:hypothetical protein
MSNVYLSIRCPDIETRDKIRKMIKKLCGELDISSYELLIDILEKQAMG